MQEALKKVCENLQFATLHLKNEKLNKSDFFLIDTAIKELIQTRNTIDFIHKEQITPINWSNVLKAMQ